MAQRSTSPQVVPTTAEAPDPDVVALGDLSRALEGVAAADVGAVAEPSSVGAEAEVELRMADLLSDDNGEIVLFNDSGVRTLGITAEAPVVADGRADPHVTAAGTDVTGYRFVTFENGPTLFFEDGLDLIIHAPDPAIA